jgi:hypothetical protein
MTAFLPGEPLLTKYREGWRRGEGERGNNGAPGPVSLILMSYYSFHIILSID